MFRAVVYYKKKCPKCDSPDHAPGNEPGLYERIDCGCVFDVVINSYPEQRIARLVAARMARLNGTRHGGVPTGHWNVETDDGIVEAN